MPVNLFRCSFVEAQAERSFVLPHLSGHIVPAPELIRKAISLGINQETTDASQCLGRQKLDFSIFITNLHQSRRVDLDPLEIQRRRSDILSHLDSIAGAMLTVGGRQMHEIRAVLREQRVLCEIRTEPAGAQDHWSVLLESLAVLDILDAHNSPLVGQQLVCLGLRHDPCQDTAAGLLNLLDHLDQRIGNCHPRKALLSTMSAGSGMPAQPGDQRQIEAELVHQPIHRGSRLIDQHLRHFLLLSSPRQRVAQEQLIGIVDSLCLLGFGL
mmetsp:Transcript_32507/g.78100  ORF Transcript_32507/g.78100 Transcript_32507/m.78100 type:complete len:269 (+) Transcript_32507:2135-2941(+)